MAQGFAQIIRRLAIFFDLQYLIENAFTVGRWESEVVCEGALRNPNRRFEERGEIRSRVDTQVAAEPGHDLILLLYKSCFRIRVVDMITAARVTGNDIFARVQVGYECDCDLTPFGSAFDEIVPFVFEMVKESPGDPLKNSSFPRAVGTTDCYESGLKRPCSSA